MKKINSIVHGGKVISFAAIFALLIPGFIKLVMLVYKNSVLDFCAKVSFGIGIIIVIVFCVLLKIEFIQDKKRDLYYGAQKSTKLSLGKGMYECQFCGNRAVKLEDKNCSVCGIFFKDKGDENEKN